MLSYASGLSHFPSGAGWSRVAPNLSMIDEPVADELLPPDPIPRHSVAISRPTDLEAADATDFATGNLVNPAHLAAPVGAVYAATSAVNGAGGPVLPAFNLSGHPMLNQPRRL